MNKQKLGTVSVDSGTLMIVDPCYVLRRDVKFDGKKEYQKVIDAEEESVCAWSHLGELALGFGGFGGDGVFPVYGYYDDKGILVKVEIVF